MGDFLDLVCRHRGFPVGVGGNADKSGGQDAKQTPEDRGEAQMRKREDELKRSWKDAGQMAAGRRRYIDEDSYWHGRKGGNLNPW